MVVYVDQLLALNALINYLLLSAATALSGEHSTRIRRALAAGLGAAYALAVLMPNCRTLGMLSLKLLCAAAMVAVAFGITHRLLRQWLMVLALSALYGGVVLAVETLTGNAVTMIGGVAYYHVSFRVLVITAGLLWLPFATVFARLAAHGGGDLVPVTLTLRGRSVACTALRDTGNSLCDPVSGRRVLIVEWDTFRRLLPDAPAALPADPVAAMQTLHGLSPELRLRLLPYRTVGAANGLLPAVQCSRIVLDGRTLPGALAAISVNPVSDGGSYHALTGGI